MLSKKIRWIKIFNDRQELLSKLVSDRYSFRSSQGDFLFVRDRGEVYAFKNRCPHQNKPLDGCTVSEGHIVCPYHQYAFSIDDGRGQGLYIEKYPIEFRENGVFVGVEKWTLF